MRDGRLNLEKATKIIAVNSQTPTSDVAAKVIGGNAISYSIMIAGAKLFSSYSHVKYDKLHLLYDESEHALDLINRIKNGENLIIRKELFKGNINWLLNMDYSNLARNYDLIKRLIDNHMWDELYNMTNGNFFDIYNPTPVMFGKHGLKRVTDNDQLCLLAILVRIKRLHDSLIANSDKDLFNAIDWSAELNRRIKERSKEANDAAREATKANVKAREKVHKTAAKPGANPEPEPSSIADKPYPDAAQPEPASVAEQVTSYDTNAPDQDKPLPETAKAEPEAASSAADNPDVDEPESTSSNSSDMPLDTSRPDVQESDTEETSKAHTDDSLSAADMSVEAPHSAEAEPATKEPEPYDHEAEFASRRASAAKFISDQELVKKSKKEVMQSDKDRLANELSSHYYYIMDTRKIRMN